ncbi:MAG: tetratricopeptide repeat protein [Campylobacterales bacterium]|nr:tetratricopeptide repeat protein [Campylobacterales bacterium]
MEEILKNADEAYQKGDYAKALGLLAPLEQEDDVSVQVLCNLGVLYGHTGALQKAVDAYQKALKKDPAFMQTYRGFGALLQAIGKPKEALHVIRLGLKKNPREEKLFFLAGSVHEALGEYAHALEAYKNTIALNPKFAKAINAMGGVLYKQGRFKEASAMFELTLQTDPSFAEAYSNLGAALNRQKRYDEAKIALETAIEKLPSSAGAYTNLGNLYNKLRRFEKAITYHERAIALDPKGPFAYANLAIAQKSIGLHVEAIENFNKAIIRHPGFVNAHFDLATTLLSLGDFEEGFAQYEWRFKKEEMRGFIATYRDIFSQPMLSKTTDARGKTVLVHSEQGFGDSIMFVRFASVLKERFACRVVLKVRDELVTLFENLEGVDEVISRSSQTPDFDFHLPMMSLAYVLDVKTKEAFGGAPYLHVTPTLDFGLSKTKLNVGICWSASATGESFEGKVFSLKYFEPLVKNENLSLVSLQVDGAKEDIALFGYEDAIQDVSALLSDFSKTAELVKQLDLVITADTSVAHLCGALGVRTWVVLQKNPDWRWENTGKHAYMYNSVLLLRQAFDGDWSSVFSEVYALVETEFSAKKGLVDES